MAAEAMEISTKTNQIHFISKQNVCFKPPSIIFWEHIQIYLNFFDSIPSFALKNQEPTNIILHDFLPLFKKFNY